MIWNDEKIAEAQAKIRALEERLDWTVEDNARKAVEIEDLRAKLRPYREHEEEVRAALRRMISGIDAVVGEGE